MDSFIQEKLLKDVVDNFAKHLADNILRIAREIAEEKESTEFITVEEMQEFLSISRAKAYELVKLNGFPVYKIGSSLRINKGELIRWIKQNGQVI